MAGPKLAMSVGGRLANALKRLIGGKVLGTDSPCNKRDPSCKLGSLSPVTHDR